MAGLARCQHLRVERLLGMKCASGRAQIGTHLFIVGRPPISAIILLVATTAIAWYRGVYK